jgi:hypothetical protein
MNADNNIETEQTEATEEDYFAPPPPEDPRNGYKQVAVFSIMTLASYLLAIAFAYYSIEIIDTDTVWVAALGLVVTLSSTALLGFITLIFWILNIYDMWRNKKFALYSTYFILLPIIIVLITMPVIIQ